MDSVEKLRGAIARAFRSWENYPSSISKFRIVGVSDTSHDRYTLQHVDDEDGRCHSSLLAHLEIRDGKIWIVDDNTEEGIATELLREGVEKREVVLSFYPPSVRELGEFAVA